MLTSSATTSTTPHAVLRAGIAINGEVADAILSLRSKCHPGFV